MTCKKLIGSAMLFIAIVIGGAGDYFAAGDELFVAGSWALFLFGIYILSKK